MLDDHDIARWEDEGGAIDLRFEDEPSDLDVEAEGTLPAIEVVSAPA